MSLLEILRILLFGYPVPAEMIDPRYPLCFQQLGGLSLSILITLLSLCVGAPLGLMLALCSSRRVSNSPGGTSRLRRWTATAVSALVHCLQTLPIMILVLLAFYLPYRLFALRIPPAILAIAAFSLYNAVYLSSIFSSGLAAVERGWLDAGRVLGLSRTQILWHIRLPILLRTMTPALVGQAITVFKDTSVLTVVALGELTYTARVIQASEPVNYGLVLGLVLLLYWSLATAGSMLVAYLENAWAKRKLGQPHKEMEAIDHATIP